MNDSENFIDCFRKLAEFCKDNGLFLSAKADVICDGAPSTGCYKFHKNNGASCIELRRRGNNIFICKTSSQKDIEDFISASPATAFEIAIACHELGHWKNGHVDSESDKFKKFEDEFLAWETGRELAKQFGLKNFDVFNASRVQSLWGYAVGLSLDKSYFDRIY